VSRCGGGGVSAQNCAEQNRDSNDCALHDGTFSVCLWVREQVASVHDIA
jgi:hypothetical protein